VHADRGHLGADIDDGLVTARVQIQSRVSRPDRPGHRERGQVDPLGIELGRQGGPDQGVDHRPVRSHQEDPHHPPSPLIHLAQGVEVQYGLVRGHRDELLDLEPQGVPQLLLGQPGKGDLADDHALVSDAEVDLPALHPGLGPQFAERLGHGVRLADLAGLHDTWPERHLSGPNDHRDVADGDLGNAHRRRPDVHADPGPGHYAPSTWTDRSER
jgi:hypothetical protein